MNQNGHIFLIIYTQMQLKLIILQSIWNESLKDSNTSFTENITGLIHLQDRFINLYSFLVKWEVTMYS